MNQHEAREWARKNVKNPRVRERVLTVYEIHRMLSAARGQLDTNPTFLSIEDDGWIDVYTNSWLWHTMNDQVNSITGEVIHCGEQRSHEDGKGNWLCLAEGGYKLPPTEWNPHWEPVPDWEP